MTRPVPQRWQRFYHVPEGTPYHVGNSFRGLHQAVGSGMRATDLDLHATSDGVPVCTHWLRPVRHDGFSGVDTPVPRTPWRVVRMWRAPSGYRIHHAAVMIRQAAALGLRVELDAKDSPGLSDRALWERLHAVAEAAGASVQVKVLSHLPGAEGRLRAAHAAGFKTIVLPRGPVPASWQPFTDYHRGPITWTN